MKKFAMITILALLAMSLVSAGGGQVTEKEQPMEQETKGDAIAKDPTQVIDRAYYCFPTVSEGYEDYCAVIVIGPESDDSNTFTTAFDSFIEMLKKFGLSLFI